MAENCPSCGAPMNGDVCEYCGHKNEQPQEKKKATINISISNNVTNNSSSTTTRVVNNTNGIPNFDVSKFVNSVIPSGKSKMVTLILCIFLGYFGVHRFYTGKIGTGIIYLFTAGIFGIGWIVDIITIAVGSYRDGNNRPLV